MKMRQAKEHARDMGTGPGIRELGAGSVKLDGR